MVEQLRKNAPVRVCKVDAELGLVFGWAVCCSKAGEPYTDLQGHQIPENAMLKAATAFMEESRRALQQHGTQTAGRVIFAWPLTEEISQAFRIASDLHGLMIGMKCDPETLAKFQSGEYRGFSIGGLATELEDIE